MTTTERGAAEWRARRAAARPREAEGEPEPPGTAGNGTGDGLSAPDPGVVHRLPGERRQDIAQPVRERRSGQELALRCVNVAVAVFALLLFLPLIVVIAVAIKLDSSGPVFYRQLRIGLDRRRLGEGRAANEAVGRRTADLGGRPFMIYKFRTMHVDAEDGTGPVWADRNDDRSTRVGRFLRKYRLDEIPQFWNVLRGDMAVVGPRPERPTFVHHLRREIDEYPLRQRVLPGITGWAQVNRQADHTVDDVRQKLRYDLEYLHRRSLSFDLRIMLRTLPVMLDADRERAREGRG